MLGSFFNRSVVIRRLKTSSGSKRTFIATATADCHYQNIENEAQLLQEGVASKTYKAWFDPDIDVQVGDVLQDATSGQKWRVLAVENIAQGFGLEAEHKEVVMNHYDG